MKYRVGILKRPWKRPRTSDAGGKRPGMHGNGTHRFSQQLLCNLNVWLIGWITNAFSDGMYDNGISVPLPNHSASCPSAQSRTFRNMSDIGHPQEPGSKSPRCQMLPQRGTMVSVLECWTCDLQCDNTLASWAAKDCRAMAKMRWCIERMEQCF